MSINLKIQLLFNSVIEAKSVYYALLPETIKPPTERSKTIVNLNGRKIYIQIYARDLTSIRAAFNSYMRMVNGITECLKLVNEHVNK